MRSETTQHRACACGKPRVWVGDGGVCLRLCLLCDAPITPCGPDTATWEINQRRRDRGEVV